MLIYFTGLQTDLREVVLNNLNLEKQNAPHPETITPKSSPLNEKIKKPRIRAHSEPQPHTQPIPAQKIHDLSSSTSSSSLPHLHHQIQTTFSGQVVNPLAQSFKSKKWQIKKQATTPKPKPDDSSLASESDASLISRSQEKPTPQQQQPLSQQRISLPSSSSEDEQLFSLKATSMVNTFSSAILAPVYYLDALRKLELFFRPSNSILLQFGEEVPHIQVALGECSSATTHGMVFLSL